jgi:phage FluMu protein Com
MEVRCGKCNKLFRVADDKITGIGIKFPCTRCGEYIRITHEEFEHYTLSLSAVPVRDLFESKLEPAEAPVLPETANAHAEYESRTFGHASQATPENISEEKAPLFVEPDHLASASAATTESSVEIKPESLVWEKPKDEPRIEPKPEQRPEPKPTPPIQPTERTKEYAHPAAPPASHAAERMVMEPIHASTSSHSGRMLLILFVTLIIAGLAAYGIYFYLQSSPPSFQKGQEAVHALTSIEGLQIVNPVGSIEANGDLLISGTIENSTEKERTAWYVVAVVNDAQGSELTTIRLLNGKQIYARRDYGILAGRGVNVQELKAKSLQEKGIIIPSHGAVKFELRYLQPLPGIASFHTQVLPFDPVQMNKEIAAELN